MERVCDICGYEESWHRPEGHKFVPSDLLIGSTEAFAKMSNMRETTRDRQVKKIHELHRELKTFFEIAKILGVSPIFVHTILEGENATVDPTDSPVSLDDAVETQTLEQELASVLNRHSAENGSNTPDFILAEYMLSCLAAYNTATKKTREWQGVGYLNVGAKDA